MAKRSYINTSHTPSNSALLAGIPVVLILAIVSYFIFFGCHAKEGTIKTEAMALITSVKETKSLGELIQLASPIYQHEAIRTGDNLGLTADVLLSNSNFPVNLRDVIPPQPDELEVKSRGRFAQVTFVDDSKKIYTFKLVQDHGKWYFYLETPLEERQYGEFRVE